MTPSSWKTTSSQVNNPAYSNVQPQELNRSPEPTTDSGHTSDGRLAEWKRLPAKITHHASDRYNRLVIKAQNAFNGPLKFWLTEREVTNQYNQTYNAVVDYKTDASSDNYNRIHKHVVKLLDAGHDGPTISLKISNLFSELSSSPVPSILEDVIQAVVNEKKKAEALPSRETSIPIYDHNDPIIKDDKETFFRLCDEMSEKFASRNTAWLELSANNYTYKPELKKLYEIAEKIYEKIALSTIHVMIQEDCRERSSYQTVMPGSAWDFARHAVGYIDTQKN